MPNFVKLVKRLTGFIEIFPNIPLKIGQKLLPCYPLLRKRNAFATTDHQHQPFNTLKADLTGAVILTLRLAKKTFQFVILCDASFNGT